MTESKEILFSRLCLHRLESAGRYVHNLQYEQDFKNSIQGNRLTMDEMEALKKRKLSYLVK
ncbi:hypothetical protein [Dialister sp.]|uniref:hypothetical protein n=1 Tax=Dialister sp. TaxID=1955814 RepID=UPI003F0DFB65